MKRNYSPASDQPELLPASPAEKPKSKYTFVDTPDGFLVQREGGIEIAITYRDAKMFLGDYPPIDSNNKNQGSNDAFGLYDNQLLYNLAYRLIDLTLGQKRYVRKADRTEGIEMIRRALGGRFSERMARVRAEVVPPRISILAKKMWASVHGDAKILHEPDLYTDKWEYLYRDLLAYHVCRLYSYQQEKRHPFGKLLETVAGWREELGAGSNWNKAINITLDKFPVGVSSTYIEVIRRWNIEKPVLRRLPIIAMLAATEHHHFDRFESIVATASDQDIIDAAAIVNHEITKTSGTRDIEGAIQNILDYDEPYHGNLVGLARRSRHMHERLRRHKYARWDVDKPTAKPGVDLEELEKRGITFLATANAVVEEGNLMEHCVATYAENAVRGGCFLFHVNLLVDKKKGITQMATVEVSPQGSVKQAHGPMDCSNEASAYGRSQLTQAFQDENKNLRDVQPKKRIRNRKAQALTPDQVLLRVE